MWFSYKRNRQKINIKMLPDSSCPSTQTHLSSNYGISIHNKNQLDLSKQVTEIQATVVLVTELKTSLDTSHFGTSFHIESFTLVSDWKIVELFYGNISNSHSRPGRTWSN